MSQFPPPPTGPYPPQGQANGKTPGVAIASMVCAIPGLCFFPLGIVALILGIVGLSKTGTPGADKGRGLALAGTILGGLSIVLAPIVIIITLMPALGAARRTAQRMENSAQLRGIQQSMTTYANSNGGYGPGLDNKGRVLADSPSNTGNSGDGDTVEARFWILLDGDYITPEYMISPSETVGVTVYQEGGSGSASPPVHFKDNGQTNYSYAMLRILKGNVDTSGLAPLPYTPSASDAPRVAEWTDQLNSQAVVLSDRNTGSNATTDARSIHTDDPNDWAGSVAWGDGRVGYETERYHETKYGSGMLNRPTTGMADNLFEDQNIGQNSSGPAGSNALMVVDGNTGVFSNDP